MTRSLSYSCFGRTLPAADSISFPSEATRYDKGIAIVTLYNIGKHLKYIDIWAIRLVLRLVEFSFGCTQLHIGNIYATTGIRPGKKMRLGFFYQRCHSIWSIQSTNLHLYIASNNADKTWRWPKYIISLPTK